MKRNSKPILIAFILTAILFFSIGFLVGKGKNTVTTDPSPSVAPVETPATVVENPVEVVEEKIKEDGVYSSKEDVALYIHTYGKLPKNYVTKKEAANLGYKASKHKRNSCRKRKEENTGNAISIMTATNATQNESFIPTTA